MPLVKEKILQVDPLKEICGEQLIAYVDGIDLLAHIHQRVSVDSLA